MLKHLRLAIRILLLSVLFSHQAFAQFPYTNGFTNATASGVVVGGSAYLTAGDSRTTDTQGNGYLRLTSNANSQAGYAYISNSFPSSKGISASFVYFTYGGSGADGICFFLFDASVTSFRIGDYGGSLGYSGSSTTGLSKGYLGIGLDEFGNFSSASFGAGGTGAAPNSVTTRGAWDDTRGGYYMLSKTQLSAGSYGFTTIGSSVTRAQAGTTGYRKVYIDIIPNANGGYNITVKIQHDNTSLPVTIIDNLYYSKAAPTNLKFGFAASTGGSNNYHEIRNLSVDLPAGSKAALSTPTLSNQTFTACYNSTGSVNIASGFVTTNTPNGSLNPASIDLDPATPGIQTTYTVATKGTFTANGTGNIIFTPVSTAATGSASCSFTAADNYGATSNVATVTANISSPALILSNPPTVCVPATVDLTAAAVTQGSDANLTLAYYTDAAAANALNNPAAVTNSGTYYIKAVNASGCSVIKPVTVTINPAITTANAGPDQTFTTATTAPVSLNGNAATSGTGLWTQLSGPAATFVNASIYNSSVGNLAPGSYVFRWTISGSCGSNSDDVMITVAGPQTITFNSITPKTYGNADFDAGAAASSGLAISYTSSDQTVAAIVNNKVHITGPGTAIITALQPGNSSYSAAANVTQNLSVNKASLTITANDQSKTYGTANPQLTISYSGFVNGETSASLTAQPNVATPASTTSAVGSYPITVNGAASPNYQITYVNGALSVYPGIQTITFTAAPKTYGDPDFTVSATASSGLPVTYSSSNTAIATVDNDGAVHIVAAGSVVISALQAGNGNYVATTRINQQFTIKKAALIIAADNQNKNYGDPNPVLTISYSGLVNNETAANLTVQPATSTTATTNSVVGIYPITVDGAASSNYNFTYINGVLSVNQIVQTLAFAAPDTKTYGDADFNLNVSLSSGLPVTYISSNPDVATVNSAGMVYILSAGNTSIMASQPGNSNYSAAADIAQNLTVNKAALTLTVDNQTISYGAAIPALTFHAAGFVNGETTDVLITQPVLNTTATAASDAGTYSIAVGDAAAAANYQITYVPGTLTINPAAQAIAVNSSVLKTYGDADFGLNATGSTTLPLTYASSNPSIASVDASGNVHILAAGTVIISVSQAGTNNYLATTIPQTITINKAALTITADDKSRAYGAANPVFTLTYAGFVMGETAAVITSAPNISTTADANSPAGNYPISINGGTADNYAFTYNPGTLTVALPVISSINLLAVTVFENQAAGTLAGTLNAASLDPNAVFTYAFLSGAGSADNGSFVIQGNKILTARSLNYEQQASYSILVRATNQYGSSFDQVFNIQINDVNEAPTLAAIADQQVCNQSSTQNIALTGITPGPETAQTTTLSVSTTNPALFKVLTAGNVTNGTATLNYVLTGTGTANITVTVKDNGGTANGGTDSFSQTFTLTANDMPVAAVSSDKGTEVVKGQVVILTATGGSSYNWGNVTGAIGATNTAVLQVRPAENTTYTVTATNASGCSSTASIRINVADDYQSIQANNILTPNGDGRNDTWVVKNLDLYPESTVIIFDKGGRRLINVKHYQNDWDGSLQGSPLAEGTYYYVIDFGPGKVPMKGFITLLRNR